MVEESCVCDLFQSQAFLVRVRPLCDGMCVRWVTILLSMGIHVFFSTQLEAIQHESSRVPYLAIASFDVNGVQTVCAISNKGISFGIQILD